MKIEHIAMYVTDLENVKKFFLKYFDAKASDCYHNSLTGFSSYFLTFSSGCRLEIMNTPNLSYCCSDSPIHGYAHIAFSVGSIEAVDKITETIRLDGYKVESGPRTTGDGYYESCIIDLEGNQIEITI